MADKIVDHSAGFDQTQKYTHSLHFTSQQWHQFWHMLIVGSAMAECWESLEAGVLEEDTCVYSKSLAEKWFSLTRKLISAWET